MTKSYYIPVLDFLQIKQIERKIGRKLDSDEVNQLREGTELILEMPDGSILIESADLLSLQDLASTGIDTFNISANSFKKDQKAWAVAQRPKEKQVKPENIVRSQIFTEISLNVKIYFEEIELALARMNDEGQKFDDPTTEFIIQRTVEGASTIDIEKELQRSDPGIKRLKRTAIRDRQIKWLTENNIKPVTF